MRGLKFTLIVGTCLAVTGCSSIWSGVGDFADFMSEKTEFLSLRKPKTTGEHVANTVPNDAGLVKASAGYYAPTGWDSTTHSYGQPALMSPAVSGSSYANSAIANCPDGAYLTAENTCMLQETASFQMTELRGYSEQNSSFLSSSALSSNVTECPSGTYLTPENTCMQSSHDVTNSMSGAHVSAGYSLDHFAKSLSGPLICPDGMVLVGAYDCRFSDFDSRMFTAPDIKTSPTSYSYEISCPAGAYKDPDNICMRNNLMP